MAPLVATRRMKTGMTAAFAAIALFLHPARGKFRRTNGLGTFAMHYI
jgi:hypothetical protein